jgi:hypothetical protein
MISKISEAFWLKHLLNSRTVFKNQLLYYKLVYHALFTACTMHDSTLNIQLQILSI